MSQPAAAGPGALPPWGRAPLPAPPPFTPVHVLRTIGPGVIGLGVAIGSGEWLLGPAVIVRHGPALLWITSVAVLLQVVLNLEMARYTLATGEPIVVGFMRTRPGPRFWGAVYGGLTLLQYGWPGWALASATASAALVLGRLPTAGDAGFVIALGYATFAACVIVVSLGRKVERTIELAMWALMGAIFLYLVFVDVTTVSAATARRVLAGFARFGALPEGGNWALLAAFAAYSGLGGMGNAFTTSWMRDKGYGMGATVGYIAAAGGPSAALAPHGNTFEIDSPALARWRSWWKFLAVDQWVIFGLGSMTGMALTALLTLEHVPPGATVGGWAVANLQASALARTHGGAFWHLTLLCGLGILFSTQLGFVEGVPRALTDIVWSSSPAARRWRGGDARPVYYAALATFVLWGCLALNLAQPLTLILIGANVAGVALVFLSLHTLVVNRRFLAPELRPSRWREAGLVLCAVFYGAFALTALLGAVGR